MKSTFVIYQNEKFYGSYTNRKTTENVYDFLPAPKHFVFFQHTSLDEILSMDYQQALQTEKTRKALANGKQ